MKLCSENIVLCNCVQEVYCCVIVFGWYSVQKTVNLQTHFFRSPELETVGRELNCEILLR